MHEIGDSVELTTDCTDDTDSSCGEPEVLQALIRLPYPIRVIRAIRGQVLLSRVRVLSTMSGNYAQWRFYSVPSVGSVVKSICRNCS